MNPDPALSADTPGASPVSPCSRSRRWPRRIVLTLTGLASLTALFYAVENWRGARAWAAALDQVKASEANWSAADLNQQPLPDDQNMVLHPAFRCYTVTRTDGTRARRTEHDQPDAQDAEMAGRWDALIKADFRANGHFDHFYDDASPAPPTSEAISKTVQELTTALAPHQPLLLAIREACQLPAASWPRAAGRETPADRYPSQISPLFFLSPLQQCAHALAANSLLNAASGKPEEAWQDMECIGQLQILTKSYGRELMSALSAASISGIRENTVIRLLECSPAIQQGAGAFENRLASGPPLTNLLRQAAEGEAFWRLNVLTWCFSHPDQWKADQILEPSDAWKFRLMPLGWLQQNAAATVKLDQEICKILKAPGPISDGLRTLEPLLTRTAKGSKISLYGWMPGMTAEIFKSIGQSFLRGEAKHVLLRTALLAAQQRAMTGKTPLSLDDLSADLKARVPRSPIHDDLPVISRDPQGTWTISCPGWGKDPASAENPALKIRGW